MSTSASSFTTYDEYLQNKYTPSTCMMNIQMSTKGKVAKQLSCEEKLACYS